MKVNEIINEGPLWDKAMAAKSAAVGGAKQVAAGVGNAAKRAAATAGAGVGNAAKRAAATAGAGLGIQAGVDAKQKITAVDSVNKAVKRVNADWAAQKAQLAAGGTQPSQEIFAQFMQARTPSVAPPTAADFTNPAAYIQKAVAQHFVNYSNGVGAYQPKDAVPGALIPGAPGTNAMPVPGAKLIHVNPEIVSFNKRIYIQNDQGLWTLISSNKPVDQAMQEFLSKQAIALSGGTA